MRNGVYRQKVGELEFTKKKVGELELTNRKQENWSLQTESGRTGVCKLIFF